MRFTGLNNSNNSSAAQKGRNEGQYEKQKEGAAPHGGRQPEPDAAESRSAEERLARLMGAQVAAGGDTPAYIGRLA
jgi:hypothetical protein